MVGGALRLGVEGVSALVSKARGSPNMENSEQVEFTDWGPSVFRVDSVDATPKSKLSIITMLLICLGVCLCLCLPFLRILGYLIRHCRIAKQFKAKSSICPPALGPPTNNTASTEDDEPVPSMESYWNSLNQTRLYAEEDQHNANNIKHRVDEEIMAREKADISDIIDKIKKSAAVKAAQKHQEEEEDKHKDY